MTNRIDSTNCTHDAALERIAELEGKLDGAEKTIEAIRQMFNIHPDAPHEHIVEMARETFKAYAIQMARNGGRR